MDTGGIEPGTDDQILSFMREQAEIAICQRHRHRLCVRREDGDDRLRPGGGQHAPALGQAGGAGGKQGRPGGPGEPDIYEFYNLGLGDPIPVSAVHGHGTGDLLDACFEYFPPEDEEETEDDIIKVAIIGKPNVGKSSLVNRILGEERVIVSDMAGTTRDAIDSYFENEKGKFCFIDTAGMRKKSKVDDRIEKFSVLRSTMAIERSDVCLHSNRRPGGGHRAGHQGGRPGPRGGQGLHHRGEQVGRHRGRTARPWTRCARRSCGI